MDLFKPRLKTWPYLKQYSKTWRCLKPDFKTWRCLELDSKTWFCLKLNSKTWRGLKIDSKTWRCLENISKLSASKREDVILFWSLHVNYSLQLKAFRTNCWFLCPEDFFLPLRERVIFSIYINKVLTSLQFVKRALRTVSHSYP